jgi:hypothetical protein
LYEAGDFPAALKLYEEAYALVPSPKIQYNFGLVYQGMGRNAEAYAAFERFLAEPSDASTTSINGARQCVERLRPMIALLEVVYDLTGAEASLSGRRLGSLPLPGPVPVDPGEHDLVLRKAGAPPVVRRVTVAAGQTLKLEIAADASTSPAPPRLAASAPPVESPPSLTVARSAPAEPRREGWVTPTAWTTLVAAGGAAAFAVYETVSYARQRRNFEDLVGPLPTTPPATGHVCGADLPDHGYDSSCKTYYEGGQRAMWLSIGGYAATAALGAVSVWLFTRGDSRGAGPTAAGCSTQGLGASCRFSF